MAISDVALRKAKGRDKPYRKSDGDGLYVIVRPNGAKWWRFDYVVNGTRKTMSLGTYPGVGLADARARREELKKLVAANVDPVAVQRERKAEEEHADWDTFGNVANDYLKHLRDLGRAEATIWKNEWVLNELMASLRPRPIGEIKAGHILPLLKKIEAKGHRETARRARTTVGSVYRYAISQLRADYDPTYALRGSLLPVVQTSHAAITDERKYGALLRAVDSFEGWHTLRAAMQIMALCYPRPIELRKAEWHHFDLKNAVWNVPAELTKMRRPHDIPLSRQAVEIIRGLEAVSGLSKYVFPSLRARDKVLSENAINSALRRLGYTQEEHCSHGFRASASSILNRRKFHPDVIERSLAHVEPNKIRRAYNRYEYWDERVEMAHAWADICDELKRSKRDNNDLI